VTARNLVIADADPRERERCEALIQGLGPDIGEVKLHHAVDGREALTLIELHRPALVLAEVLLEGGSGLALLRRLRRLRGAAAPPFIFVTTMARESDRYWGLRNGAHGYVMKPYEDDVLQAKIREVLAGNQEPERLNGL
jgi:twitching motility two-component system response regulator PilH